MKGTLSLYMGMETEGSNIHVFFEGDANDLNNMRGLENGDFLTIYSKNTGYVIWDGLVKLVPNPTYPSVECYLNHNTCQIQQDVDPEKWNRWFANGYPAHLKKKL